MSTSPACCTRPAAQAEYTPKGTFQTLAGLKTYRAGSPTASKAVLMAYDIFGLAPQTIQGADIIAATLKDTQVFLPDYLNGEIAQHSWFSPSASDEDKKAMTEYFAGVGNPVRSIELSAHLMNAAEENSPGIKDWAALGLCWGHKITAALAGQETLKTTASVHPSFIDAADAAKITVPMCVLASGEEDAEAVKAFEAALKGEKYFETFGDMPHGWMGARGDLKDPRAKAEYERGYEIVCNFFAKHL